MRPGHQGEENSGGCGTRSEFAHDAECAYARHVFEAVELFEPEPCLCGYGGATDDGEAPAQAANALKYLLSRNMLSPTADRISPVCP